MLVVLKFSHHLQERRNVLVARLSFGTFPCRSSGMLQCNNHVGELYSYVLLAYSFGPKILQLGNGTVYTRLENSQVKVEMLLEFVLKFLHIFIFPPKISHPVSSLGHA